MELQLGAPRRRVTLTWRPPTPADLRAAASAADPVADLTRRCLRMAPAGEDPDRSHGGDPALGDLDQITLDGDVLAAIEQAMAEADPLAEVVAAVTCPYCTTGFPAEVDLGEFVWSELEALARRLLVDVDLLARAYGWTEHDVLALSDARRAAYVRMASGGTP
jgi:hypothetical protein